MQPLSPLSLITIGGLLVFFSVCAAFSMVLRIVEASFLLSFLSYGASIVGMFLGLIGMVQYRQQDRG
ncbi:hypothetical protein KFU94_60735 [Chloroflexi bacterium TSY]|nr:hypothetical protein [Chloroflexi bacterium TSY]